MTDKTVLRALQLATTEQIKSEWAKRTQAMRKTRSGGKNGGRPQKSVAQRGLPPPRSTPGK